MASRPQRSRIDPKLAAVGLLAGAAVGVWAGRKAQDWSAEHQGEAPGLIDWERARSIAVSMNQEAALTAGERERLDGEYFELVQRTIPLVSQFSGTTLPFPL